MRTILAGMLSLALLMGGCATRLTPALLESADYGELNPQYKEAIKAHMQTLFYDPEGARYRYVKEPVKGFAYVPNNAPKLEFGYIVEAHINAKNRLGAYTGEERYQFLVKNDTAWMLHEWTSSGTTNDALAEIAAVKSWAQKK